MIIQKSKQKYEEAQYFLMKMQDVETSSDSSGQCQDREREYSHLLSAFLNACYSVGEILKQEIKYVDEVKNIRLTRRDIYKNGANGGWRTISVHFSPVKPEVDGYIPPPGDKIILNFSYRKKYTPPPGDNIVLDFGKNKRFYFTKESPQNSITDICREHLGEIQKLVSDCEIK